MRRVTTVDRELIEQLRKLKYWNPEKNWTPRKEWKMAWWYVRSAQSSRKGEFLAMDERGLYKARSLEALEPF